jgi:uncharacterized cupin superfamily protein
MAVPSVNDDIHSDAGLEPSLPAEGREDGSTARVISRFDSPDAPVLAAVWSAEPGVFNHPGGAGGETFVVVTGSGEIEIDGLGTYELAPGVIVAVPPDTASRMTVREPLRKFAVFPVAG